MGKKLKTSHSNNMLVTQTQRERSFKIEHVSRACRSLEIENMKINTKEVTLAHWQQPLTYLYRTDNFIESITKGDIITDRLSMCAIFFSVYYV